MDLSIAASRVPRRACLLYDHSYPWDCEKGGKNMLDFQGKLGVFLNPKRTKATIIIYHHPATTPALHAL